MTTRWAPDTCGCVLEYDDPNGSITIIHLCPKHVGQPASIVFAHNRNKNNVQNWISSNKANFSIASIENLIVNYDSSNLSASEPVMVKGPFTTTQVTNLQNALDSQFGKGIAKVSQ